VLTIDPNGMVVNGNVRAARQLAIERGDMQTVNGIIVHQTGGSSAASALSSYTNPAANGAHFLIDRDGTVYQTASLKKKTWHVGKLKARCLLEKRCSPTELVALSKYNPKAENTREQAKSYPARFPSNEDSIGIELVGEALPRGNAVPQDQKTYEAVTSEQNASLKWLIAELTATLSVPLTEVFRHPDVSRKNASEAKTATW
jgi:N-acetyl-anhydromuramyl-L-alanine amidase AmpD